MPRWLITVTIAESGVALVEELRNLVLLIFARRLVFNGCPDIMRGHKLSTLSTPLRPPRDMRPRLCHVPLPPTCFPKAHQTRALVTLSFSRCLLHIKRPLYLVVVVVVRFLGGRKKERKSTRNSAMSRSWQPKCT